MRNILLFIILLTSGWAYAQTEPTSQKANTLGIFVNPYLQKIGNLNKQYTETSNEFIDVDYIKMPSLEIGLQFHHNFKGKWGWGIGTSWKHSINRTQVNLLHPQWEVRSVYSFYRRATVESVSLRLMTSYKFNSRIRLNLFLSAYGIVKESTNTDWKQNLTTFSKGIFYYKTKVGYSGYLAAPKLVPECSVDMEIIKNLNLNLGVRWKFWEREADHGYNITVSGFNSPETVGQDNVLHSSKENSREMSFYMGLSYDLPLKRKKK